MTFEQINEKLKNSMTINGIVNERYYHSVGVMNMAIKINEYYHLGLDNDKLKLAGILHDCAKLYDKEELYKIVLNNEPNRKLESLKRVPQIVHGFAGKYVARDVYGITDKDILDAIYYHTIGKADMSLYEEVIFVSDYVEEGRIGDHFAAARDAVFTSLHYGTYIIIKQTFDYLKNSGKILDEAITQSLKFYQKYERN